LEDDREAVKSWTDGGGFRLRKKCSSERGLGKPEGERTNRRESRATGDAAELTEGTDATRAQRRLQNDDDLR
jgi:hypothetical protein